MLGYENEKLEFNYKKSCGFDMYPESWTHIMN